VQLKHCVGIMNPVSNGFLGDMISLAVSQTSTARRLLLLHARLGGISTEQAKALPETTVNSGLPDKPNGKLLETIAVCSLRKEAGMLNPSYHTSPARSRATHVGGRVGMDAWGKYRTAAAGLKPPCHFLIGSCDELSDWGKLIIVAEHTTEAYLAEAKQVDLIIKKAGHPRGTVTLRVDNAPELISSKFEEGAARMDMLVEHSCDYEKTGVAKAERGCWGYTLPVARHMMLRCGGNTSLTLHALVYARLTRNTLRQRHALHSRDALVFGEPPDLEMYKIFGARGWARIEEKDKGKAVSHKCVFIGLGEPVTARSNGGMMVIIGEGANAHIETTTRADLYESNLITRGVVDNTTKIDASTQCSAADIIGATAAHEGDKEQEHEEPEMVPPATKELTLAQARPRRAGHDRSYNLLVTNTEVIAGLDSISALLALSPSTAWHLVASETPSSALLNHDMSAREDGKVELVLLVNNGAKPVTNDMLKDTSAKGKADVVNALTAAKGSKFRGSLVQLVGPQGIITRVQPKDSREANITAEAGSWYNLVTAHIAALESDGVLIECHADEANGEKIYPSQMEYKIKINPDTGTHEKDKVRGCMNTIGWNGLEPVYAETMTAADIKLLAASAVYWNHHILKVDIKDAHPKAPVDKD